MASRIRSTMMAFRRRPSLAGTARGCLPEPLARRTSGKTLLGAPATGPSASRPSLPWRCTSSCYYSSESRPSPPAPSAPLTVSNLEPQEFHQISDRTLDGLTDVLERLVESDHPDVSGWDVDYSSGVMHFSLGNAGTYVINKQPPNKQIWLSSPFSGPKRFDYDKEQGCWFYGREGRELMSLLGKEVDEVLGDSTFSDLLRASSLLPPP